MEPRFQVLSKLSGDVDPGHLEAKLGMFIELESNESFPCSVYLFSTHT
jgi:hypothetical protein